MKRPSWLQRSLGHSTKAADAFLHEEGVVAIRSAAADAQRSRLPQMAAALSYRTIFGLIPIIIVALLLIRAFTTEQQRVDIIRNAMEYTALKSIAVNERAANQPPILPVEGSTPSEAPAAVASRDPSAGPVQPTVHEKQVAEATQSLEQLITQSVERAEESISFSLIGLIGLVTFIYAAISMLVEIERAFNQIYCVPRGRSWARRLVNYWALLTLGGIGLFATFYFGAQFHASARHIIEQRGWSAGSGAISLHLVGYAISVCISTLVLLVAYLTVPNTRVKPIAAFTGSLVAALCWEAGKWGFTQYVTYSTGYSRIYGSLALIPLFLLWVYYTWLIVLFGLLVAYQIQYGRTKTRAQPLWDMGPTVVEPSSGLLVMSAVARAMAAGSQLSIPGIAKATGLSEPVVTLVVGRFAERGLLLRVERNQGIESDTLYTLARTPGSIRLAEILAIAFELAGGPETNPVVERLRAAQINAAGSETLADAAGLTGDVASKPSPKAASPAQPVESRTVTPPSEPLPQPRPAPQTTERPATLG